MLQILTKNFLRLRKPRWGSQSTARFSAVRVSCPHI